jgi:WD40 repeat protein
MSDCKQGFGYFLATACWIGSLAHSAAAQGTIGLDQNGDPLPKHAVARLGMVRLTHGGRILGLFPSEDSRTVMAVDAAGMIRTWDVLTGKQLSRCELTAKSMSEFVALSSDRKLIAGIYGQGLRLWDSASGATVRTLAEESPRAGRRLRPAFGPGDKTLMDLDAAARMIVWDVATGKKMRVVELDKPDDNFVIIASAFSADATLLAGARGAEVRLWNTATGKLVRRLQGGSKYGVYSSVFSPDGKQLAAGQADRSVILWDVASGKIVGELEKTKIREIAFSPDSKRIFVGDSDGDIRMHDVQSLNLVKSIKRLGAVGDEAELAVSADGKLLVAQAARGWAASTRLGFWDIDSGNRLSPKNEAPIPFPMGGARFASDGRSIYLTNSASATFPRTERYSVPDLKLMRAFSGILCGISPDGKAVATVDERMFNPNQICCFWDAATGTELWRRDVASGMTSVELTRDGTKLVLEAPDRKLRVASAQTGNLLSEYTPLDFRDVRQAVISRFRDASVVYSSNLEVAALIQKDNAGIRVFDWKGGKTIREFGGLDPKGSYDLSFSPDARYLLASDRHQESLRLWHVASGKPEDDVPQGRFTAFSPDRALLCMTTGEGLVFWDLKARRIRATLKDRVPDNGVVFSGDGKSVAMVEDRSVIVVQIDSGKTLRFMHDLHAPFFRVEFAPDCRSIMTVTDIDVLLWQLPE